METGVSLFLEDNFQRGLLLPLWKFGDIIAPKLSINFIGLIHRGSFPECWQSANVTAIPKGAPSP